MGETVNLQSALAGQYGLNDWLGQQNNLATPQGLVPLILPVQDMREFQRRYLFDQGTQSLVLGERISLLSWTVPPNEYWRPLSLIYQNADAGTHTVLTQFTMARNPAALVYQPSRTLIRQSSTKVVYGTVWDASDGAANEQHYSSPIYVVMEPGDSFGFEDITVNVGASQQRWIFVYELVPQPATQRTPGVAAAVTVV